MSFRPGASESRQRLRSARPDGVRSDADLVIHGPLQNDKDLAAKAEGLVAHAMQRRLLTAWRDARDGKTQLPPKVMTLFDWLVHDAMLSSWPDHLLASTRMYFRVRDKDVFAKTDAKAEMEQRAKDMRNAEKVEAMAARNEQNIRQMTPARL